MQGRVVVAFLFFSAGGLRCVWNFWDHFRELENANLF
jgi:hypothetical protein